MNSYFTIALLAAAGVALVMQNLLMVRITEAVSTVLITLVINSSMGLALLLATLLLRNGMSGVIEGLATLNELDMNALLEERKMRIAISVYGYLKRMAAIQCLQHGKDKISVTEAQAHS